MFNWIKNNFTECFLLWHSERGEYVRHHAPSFWLKLRYTRVGTASYCPGCYNIMEIQLLPSVNLQTIPSLAERGEHTQFVRLKCCSRSVEDFEPYKMPIYVKSSDSSDFVGLKEAN